MGPSNMYFSSASPTVVLTPQNVPEPFGGEPLSSPPRFANSSPFNGNGTTASPAAFGQWLQSKQEPSPVQPSRGRKRSCDEMASLTEADATTTDTTTIAPPPQPEPIYGEGMTLIQPSGYIIDASSQTGTWLEEKAKEEPEAPLPTSSAPIEIPSALQSRKSQRLDSDLSSSPLAPRSASPAKFQPTGPPIDDFTLLLGVGWTRLNAVPAHVEEAMRGWTRYIDNHYPLTNPTMLLQSKAHDSFLVGAQEGFFLFDESLGEARLVGASEQTMLANLRSQPVAFEGTDSLKAVGTPNAIAAAAMAEGDAMIAEQAIMSDVVMPPSASQEISMQLD
ncbi:MAG: hypothetical protein M4579_000938 [Chaenotheca gracillima]|nr:MAG: hypothetical protein M4579_000938 [Chaenotheca gracillima]